MGIVVFQHGDPLAGQIGAAMDVGVVVADDDCAMHGDVGKGEIEERLALGRPADQGQAVETPVHQILHDRRPLTGLEGDVAAHGLERGPQEFHRIAASRAVLGDHAVWRVVDLATGKDGGTCR